MQFPAEHFYKSKCYYVSKVMEGQSSETQGLRFCPAAEYFAMKQVPHPIRIKTNSMTTYSVVRVPTSLAIWNLRSSGRRLIAQAALSCRRALWKGDCMGLWRPLQDGEPCSGGGQEAALGLERDPNLSTKNGASKAGERWFPGLVGGADGGHLLNEYGFLCR